MNQKVKIAVMVSGGGTNLQAILDAQDSGILHSGEVALVVSNKPSAYALQRAQNKGVETAVIQRRDFSSQVDYEDAIIRLFSEKEIDLIVMAGFMSIVSPHFTDTYPKRIINVHPSLIPSFCGEGFYGLRVHRAALSYGVKVTGATVHYVNEIPDGGEIIAQKAVEVLPGDTPEILQKRVMEQAEWILLPQALEMISSKYHR